VGPPLILKALKPTSRVAGPYDISGDSAFVFHHEGKVRFKQGVRGGINMAHELPVAVEMRGVPALVPSRKRNQIERVEIGRVERSYVEHVLS
jgi:hypothetical protein